MATNSGFPVPKAFSGHMASANFPQFESVLNQPTIQAGFQARLWQETIFPDIAQSNAFDQLRCGTTVIIHKEPDIQWLDYEMNQTLEIQDQEICDHELYIGYMKYAAVKIDDDMVRYVCKLNELQPHIENRLIQSAKDKMEAAIFDNIYWEAHPDNQGNTAGAVSHAYDLGAIGNPYTWTPDGFVNWMTHAALALDELDVPSTDRFMVLPYQAKTALTNSVFARADQMGGCVPCSPALTGLWFRDIQGFDIYFSRRLRFCIDPVTGDPIWVPLFGHRDHLAFTMDMSNFEVVPMERAFGRYMRVKLTFGAGAPRNEGLGFGVVTIPAL